MLRSVKPYNQLAGPGPTWYSVQYIALCNLLCSHLVQLSEELNLNAVFFNPSPSSHAGVWQVWLRFCERQGDEGQGEDDGELHPRIPKCSAGAQRVDPPSPPPDWGVRHGAEPDQRVEGANNGHQSEVLQRVHLLLKGLCDCVFCSLIFSGRHLFY